ncbi:hypothetical protein [[Phormidium] sp. ETS-05]|nr:hypothetical protein [[Phormidium] sp. ETS-05]
MPSRLNLKGGVKVLAVFSPDANATPNGVLGVDKSQDIRLVP